MGISIANEVFGGPPDLVVSGIHAGASIGAAAQISGTVGATVVSLANPDPPDIRKSDTVFFKEGYIEIVPIEARLHGVVAQLPEG